MADEKQTEALEIKHWRDGRVLFSCQVEIGLSLGQKRGVAVKLAFAAGASLDGASLDGARLDGARLVGASLVGARLDGARLVGASLVGARLDGASLVGARLVGARLDGAEGILDCGTPHGYRVAIVRHDDGIRLLAGCRWFTMDAAATHWSARKDRTLMMPLLEYIKAAVAIKGWKL